MTAFSAPDYKAPKGFFQNLTFDKAGSVFADGKQLSGFGIDPEAVKSAMTMLKPSNPMDGFFNLSNQKTPTEFNGGAFSRLEADEKGNVYGVLSPKSFAPDANGKTLGDFTSRMQNTINDNPLISREKKIPLTGIKLDPARTSRNSTGKLPVNNVYLREERDGLYFAQVDTKEGTAAYAYSAYQDPSSSLGGPDNTKKGRKQGGNAGGGVGPSAPSGVSLLGS